MSGNLRVETVRTDGFQMDYLRFGHGSRAFVILPGLSVGSVLKFADSIAQAYSPLADHFSVYLFDRRKALPETYSVYDMARDTATAMRTLGLDHVCLFGASQGGMIAMALTADHPGLVGKLLLGSTAAFVDREYIEAIRQWIRLAEAGHAEALYRAFGKAIYPQAVFEQSLDLLDAATKEVTNEDLERFIIQAKALDGFDITGRLPQIHCPVLVLGSRDDAVLGRSSSETLAAAFGESRNCMLHMYNGYGHAAYDLAPDYKQRLLQFCLQESE